MNAHKYAHAVYYAAKKNSFSFNPSSRKNEEWETRTANERQRE